MAEVESKAPAQRLDDLMTEISNLVDIEHGGAAGYEASADAMWKAALAVFNFAASEVGATGFQASWAALRFYGEAMSIKGPFLVMKLEDALFPQYDLPGRLAAYLKEHREWLRQQAKEKLAGDLSYVHPDVLAHWQKLAGPDGV